MRFINPYSGVDFASTPHILANTHEHLNIGGTDPEMNSVRKSWNRGIRWFANLTYNPSAPAYPYYGWESHYDTYNTIPDDYTIIDGVYTGGFDSFVDKDGNTIYSRDLPHVPNNERVRYATTLRETTGKWRFANHFNVLGSLFGDNGVRGNGGVIGDKIDTNPIVFLSEIQEIFSGNLLFEGKTFATINHCASYSRAKELLNAAPRLFMACELYNHLYSRETNQEFRNVYDTLLKEGYRLWAVSVVDWQEIQKAESETKCDRGCNVLLIDGYNNMTVAQKTEAGLDAYISGSFYASGRGVRKITSLSVNEDSVSLTVDGNPTSIKAITNLRTVNCNNGANVRINPGEEYIRYEVYYDSVPSGWDEMTAEQQDAYCADGVKDFIFTNPIWIEDNGKKSESSIVTDAFALGII